MEECSGRPVAINADEAHNVVVGRGAGGHAIRLHCGGRRLQQAGRLVLFSGRPRPFTDASCSIYSFQSSRQVKPGSASAAIERMSFCSLTDGV